MITYYPYKHSNGREGLCEPFDYELDWVLVFDKETKEVLCLNPNWIDYNNPVEIEE